MESTNEKNYAFIKLPKKSSLLLAGTERALLGTMIDYQQMNKDEAFEMSISYICKNLSVTDKTAQKAINQLVILNLIHKESGQATRKRNRYSINFDQIMKYDQMSNDEIFKLRTKDKQIISLPEQNIEEISKPEEKPIEPCNEPEEDSTSQSVPVITKDDNKTVTQLIDEFDTLMDGLPYNSDERNSMLRELPNYFTDEQIKSLLSHVCNSKFKDHGWASYMKYLYRNL
jgi:predicted transcriptional regulator